MELRAGPVVMLFEPETTFLRYVRLGDREIVRAIYGAVRDRNWDTVTPEVSDVQLSETDGGFRLTFHADCRKGNVDFRWNGTISGDAQGTVTYTFDGTAHSTFLRNRIGLCVLHPIRECAGAPCTVEHTDGTMEQSAFPQLISPHQPFMDMRAISHTVIPGVAAEVRFAGEIFETEDQRNWTDASYKTYSTPLALPFPVEVAEGTPVRQSVTIRLHGNVPADSERPSAADPAASGKHVVRIEAGDTVPLPQVGLGMVSHDGALSERARERLRALRPAHLRVDLHLSRSGFREVLTGAAAEARAIGTALEVALLVSDAAEQELADVVAAAREIQPPVARWLLFHQREKSTSEPWVSLGRRVLSQFDPAIPLVSGTNIYFTELNRGRPTPEALAALDLVCYSLNPQVHAFDNASLVESLEGQAATVASARAIAGDRRLAITPVTLRPRFNPNATGPDSGERPPQGDPRQTTRFCAAWTIGSLKQLSQAGVASLTYFETTGSRGLMEDTEQSAKSAVFPVYHVLADVTAFAGGKALPTTSSNPLAVEALAVRYGSRHRVLLANLTANEQRVRLEGIATTGEGLSLRLLDEESEDEATRSPEAFRDQPGASLPANRGALSLTLRPYAVARLDWSLG